jgi:hypothetical protein
MAGCGREPSVAPDPSGNPPLRGLVHNVDLWPG